ncbi:MAG TPA: NAD-dependent epimerase/dehydratase family protein [Acidimicrobiales bacterium]|nr:NAD-dependent epimerase/dehydratase family protein [Acidimicrobiales bacterium]
MRVLVIGGTQFVGRAVVEAYLARGDEVTIFHRGKTNPGLFDGVVNVLGDRDNESDLARIEGEFEVTFDSSAYVPRQVRSLAEALAGRGGHYVHVSSISVYAPRTTRLDTEDAPVVTLEDPSTEVVSAATYGGLKYLCEVAAHAGFGPGGPSWNGAQPTIIRPTYVAGPFDHTYRFTWWVERIARGGDVLAPGPASNPFQVIDVRDLADFVVARSGMPGGIYHVAGPTPPFSFGDFLNEVVDAVGPADTRLRWVDGHRLIAAGVGPGDLPLWEGPEEALSLLALDTRRARDAGLSTRALAETINAVALHEQRTPTTPRSKVGLSGEDEARILAELADA